MVWQDIIITFVSIVFAYAMLPQINYGFKKKRGVITYQFSILNIISMGALIIAYYSLGLFFFCNNECDYMDILDNFITSKNNIF